MKRYIAILLLLTGLAATARAREVFPINEGWRFFFKSEKTSDNARHVTLPHSWNTDPLAQGYWLETTGSYQNGMYIPVEWASKRLFVKFYGVQSVADLFVNGYHVGTHRGGATAFTFEITDKIRFGSDNSMLVVVSNSSRDDVLPTSTDMNLYGGIYRGAELIVTERTAVSPLYFGSDGVLVRTTSVTDERVEGEAEIHLTSSSGEASCLLTLDITAPGGERVYTRRQRVRLDGANELYPAELSGGMIKRVAIARAIVMNPRYLFCDEPNSGLDPQTSIVIDNLIHEITEEYGITTIINTHDMNSVMEIGEKIVYIHEGRKWWEGTKEEILHADNRELNDFVFASAMAKRAKKAVR